MSNFDQMLNDFMMTVENENKIVSNDKKMTRAKRRKKDFSKALRKKKIDAKRSSHLYYNNLHQYSKNKIHCSCPLCSFNHKKKGYVVIPFQDMKRLDDMNLQMTEYYSDEYTECA